MIVVDMRDESQDAFERVLTEHWGYIRGWFAQEADIGYYRDHIEGWKFSGRYECPADANCHQGVILWFNDEVWYKGADYFYRVG